MKNQQQQCELAQAIYERIVTYIQNNKQFSYRPIVHQISCQKLFMCNKATSTSFRMRFFLLLLRFVWFFFFFLFLLLYKSPSYIRNLSKNRCASQVHKVYRCLCGNKMQIKLQLNQVRGLNYFRDSSPVFRTIAVLYRSNSAAR